jgi:hypothetical protein
MIPTTEDYEKATAAFQNAKRQVEEMASLIKGVGEAIAKGSFSFAQSDISVSTGAMLIDPELHVTADQWPHAGLIMQATQALRDARAHLLNVWNQIPANAKTVMIPPHPDVLPNKPSDRRRRAIRDR